MRLKRGLKRGLNRRVRSGAGEANRPGAALSWRVEKVEMGEGFA